LSRKDIFPLPYKSSFPSVCQKNRKGRREKGRVKNSSRPYFIFLSDNLADNGQSEADDV
jgi:hypothetical protein